MTSRPISRSAGERAPDLTGMKVAHRAMLADTRRFTEIVHRIGAGEACGARRRRTIADYLGLLCDSIHHHHTVEDDVVWPILESSAGAAIDVRELQDDHAELEGLLGDLRNRVDAFARAREGGQAGLG
ncbi:hemerythrin domain-containing protein [Gordonia paraffinivorans]|uniref:hemerythrin domain-containing protein n=1 Tax=Gordonia paraffinivorans TaxID=175628 RepID=UPI002896C1BC|nr:hemerythrin domain-containing protein [Gordonia paraffinivorans]